jgi:hypothetical protein
MQVAKYKIKMILSAALESVIMHLYIRTLMEPVDHKIWFDTFTDPLLIISGKRGSYYLYAIPTQSL